MKEWMSEWTAGQKREWGTHFPRFSRQAIDDDAFWAALSGHFSPLANGVMQRTEIMWLCFSLRRLKHTHKLGTVVTPGRRNSFAILFLLDSRELLVLHQHSVIHLPFASFCLSPISEDSCCCCCKYSCSTERKRLNALNYLKCPLATVCSCSNLAVVAFASFVCMCVCVFFCFCSHRCLCVRECMWVDGKREKGKEVREGQSCFHSYWQAIFDRPTNMSRETSFCFTTTTFSSCALPALVPIFSFSVFFLFLPFSRCLYFAEPLIRDVI